MDEFALCVRQKVRVGEDGNGGRVLASGRLASQHSIDI